MCGICGIVSSESQVEEYLFKMLLSLHHRGPDQNGTFKNSSVGLGNARLAIIDISGSQQPIFNEDQSLIVVFNGEIYNYRELRQELENHGHKFYTTGDTEVLLHLYEEYDTKMLNKLNGQFAFSIWDEQKHELFAARDRFGIKPFWYYKTSSEFVFASEPQTLFHYSPLEKKINPAAIAQFLSFRATPHPNHIFENVFSLSPGSWLKYTKERLKKVTYWKYPTPIVSNTDEKTIIDKTEHLLTQAIRYRLISDVPVGVLLSGGVDSALITALTVKLSDNPVKTFCLGFKDASEKFNETSVAGELAKRLGTEHIEMKIEPEQLRNDLPDIIKHLPSPCGDGIQKYYISKLVSKHVKVVLSGSGADELFAGYEWFHKIIDLKRFDAFAQIFPHELASNISKFGNFSFVKSEKLRKIAFYLNNPNFVGRYDLFKSMIKDSEKKTLLSPEFLNQSAFSNTQTVDFILKLLENVNDLSELDKIGWLQIVTDLPDIILLNEDSMSMAHSVEMRLPYLDHQLAEYVAKLHSSTKIKGNIEKYILRKLAVKYLPANVAFRQKHGFIMPLSLWLRTELKDYVDSVFSKDSVEKRGIFQWNALQKLHDNFNKGKGNPYLVWNLTVLELWLRIHFDNTNI